ncbi:MAG: TetR/AcrR family transcriptional regulator, partial [Clostridia bacterium]|nr:TetR/AcrR family transcriptional regulator [Clostridia bacterium]
MAAPRSDNVKEIILAKTSELMEETGLSSISLASIAEACGISKGTLYYHYKTKEDIFFDLIERHFREQEQELIAWMDDLSKDVSVNRL